MNNDSNHKKGKIFAGLAAQHNFYLSLGQ